MRQIINLGSGPNSGNGDGARTGGQKINDNFEELYDTQASLIADSNIYNRIVVSNGFSILDQDITVNAGMQWLLANLDYTNPADVEIFIPFCAAGKSRIEYLVPNDEDGFTRVFGPESATVLIAPELPNKNMYVTFYIVTENSIGDLEPTFLGENFITKQEKSPFQVYNSGEIDNIGFDDFFYGYLNFRSAVTNLKSISVTTNNFLYTGKEILVKNSQTTDITIFHLTGTDVFRFSFPNAANLVLKPNEIIRFSLKILSPSNGVLEYVGTIDELPIIEIADVDGLTATLNDKLDKDGYAGTAQDLKDEIDTKLDTSAYNQHFKGVYTTLSALNIAHPTATVGDYAQVNETGATDVVNYSWDDEDDVWVAGGGTGGAANTDALPEGSTNLYWTVARFLANLTYSNVISALGFTPSTAPNNAQKNSDITKAEIEAKLTGEITTHTHAASSQNANITVVKIGANTTLDNTYNGKMILLTASCTLTLPNGLALEFNYSVKTRAGVTLTYALGSSVVLLDNVGTTMAGNLSHTMANTGVLNEYLSVGNL